MKKSLGAKNLGFPAPVFIVGSYNDKGEPNVMNAAAGGICCLTPPCIYVSLREATCTYHNIMKRNAFTVSIPSDKYMEEADYFGLATGKKVDKFEVSGLTPVQSELVDAPYILEFPVVISCQLKETIFLGSHTMFIGEVVDLKADEEVLSTINVKEGQELIRINIEEVSPLIYDLSLRGYYKLGEKVGEGFKDGLKLFK